MIKHKAYWTNGCIDQIEVIKETKNFVFLVADKEWFHDGRKEAKESDYHKYFDNYGDAKEWVIKNIDAHIEKNRIEIARFELYRDKAKNSEGVE